MKEEREALEKYYSWIPSDCLDFFAPTNITTKDTAI